MIFLAEFSVIKPDWGLLFWTAVIFILFWVLIGKYAFRPIARALKKREDDIQSALSAADDAKRQMMELKAQNEELLEKAREERAMLLRDAKDTSNKIIGESKKKAKEDAAQIVATARQEIENQKQAALEDVKNQVGRMAVDVAEKILRQTLSKEDVNEDYINKLVDDVNLN